MKRKWILVSLFIYLLSCARMSFGQLATSPWPMFRHDAKHTGQSPYIGPRKGTLAWSYSTGRGIYSSPSIGADGRAYVSSFDDMLYALNPGGVLIWSYNIGSNKFSSPALCTGGQIYIGSQNYRVLALTSGGTLFWSYAAGLAANFYSFPAMDSGGRVYIGSADNSIYAFTSTGSLVWSYATGDGLGASSPAIDDQRRIYVGSGDNRVYAVASPGALSWSYETGGYVDSSPAIGTDGRVYVGSNDNNIYALTSEGSLLWSYVSTGYVFSSSAVSSDGAAYIGSGDSRTYALTSTGSLSWSYKTGDSMGSSPARDFEGRFYSGSDDNNIYSLTSAGALSWSYVTGDSIFSSPALDSDGRLYVGSIDDLIYCFQDPTASHTPTATPTLTPIPVPTISLSLNGDKFKTGDELWLTIDVTVPPGSYEGLIDAYIMVETPSGKFFYLNSIRKTLSLELLTPFNSLTKRTENPQIALNISPWSGSIDLDYDLAYGTRSRRKHTDIYCGIATADNKWYWYVYPDKFVNFSRLSPAVPGIYIKRDVSGLAHYFSLGNYPQGVYTWYAVLVPLGKDVRERKNWLCKASKAAFKIGPTSYRSIFHPGVRPYVSKVSITKNMQAKIPLVILSQPKGTYTWWVYFLKSELPPHKENILSQASIPFEIIPEE